jgi:CheY-like chemotaxis protein
MNLMSLQMLQDQEQTLNKPKMQDRSINILLVEDDEVDIMNVRRAFKKGGVKNSLFVAGNGLEALDMLTGQSGKPPVVPPGRRLILLDLNMPKMGGIEFLRVLRANAELKAIPVVVLTTSGEDCDRVQAYDFNVAGYLLKPIAFEPFVQTMTTLNTYWTLCEMP